MSKRRVMNDLEVSQPDGSRAGVRVNCQGLWKQFGTPDATREKAHRFGRRKRERPETARPPAVKDVSFDVDPGESFVIMGLSGSGKSTLLRCLIRLIEPNAGKVTIDDVEMAGLNPNQLRDTRRRDFAMVFQHFGLLPHRSVRENVELGLRIRGVDKEERASRARDALNKVGLPGVENASPASLSGGMKQRVGLARALVVEPRLLLMDEPFSALDPLIRSDLQQELLGLRRKASGTMIFVTHDMKEAIRLGDRIAVMRAGEVVQIATPAELVLEPADEYIQKFVSEVPRTMVLTAGDIARPATRVRSRESDWPAARRRGAPPEILMSDSGVPQRVRTDTCGDRQAESDEVVIDVIDPLVVPASIDLASAARKLTYGERCLVTSDESKDALGVLTQTDVLKALSSGESADDAVGKSTETWAATA